MLLAINLAAGAVLLAIDLPMLLRGQPSAVRRAVGSHLPIDALFAIFGSGTFSSVHRSIANPVGNSVLLILAALAHFIVAVMRLRRVVLVVVNRAAQVVLLPVHLVAFLLRQLAAVGRAIVVDLAVKVPFAGLQTLGFTRGELAGLHAVRDAVLLVLAAIVNRSLLGRLLRGLALLRENGCRKQSAKSDSHKPDLHRALHMNPPNEPLFFNFGPHRTRHALPGKVACVQTF